MKNTFLAIWGSVVFALPALAQTGAVSSKPPVVEIASPATKYAQTIEANDLRKHLFVLASAEYEGRETGQLGQKKAAEYIKNHFKDLGLQPICPDNSYFQDVPLSSESWESPTITVKKKTYTFLKDFYAFGQSNNSVAIQTNEILFLGYGIAAPQYDDYAGVDVRDKLLLVLAGEPTRPDGNFMLSGTKEPSEWSINWRKKLALATEKGAKGLLIVMDDIDKQMRDFIPYISSSRMEFNTEQTKNKYTSNAYIGTHIAQQILGKRKKTSLNGLKNAIIAQGKPINRLIKRPIALNLTKKRNEVNTENVLGFMEGTDLKNEVLVITAHYDHLGKIGNDIYFGADDDGSGTVALLDIAQAFAKAKQDGKPPRRSILFMTVTGEEKGLYGSQYYTDYQPILPLANTVADLNIDMVGRIDPLHQNSNYVYIIGSDKLSTELHQINEEMNSNFTHLELDYKYNDENDPNRFYYRSDHYNFAKNNIPIIFYFNGTHADYHQPTDTPDKIDYDGLQKRAQLVFYTAWELANRDKRISVDKPSKAPDSRR